MHKFATKSVFLIGDKLLVKYFPEAGRSPRDNGRRGSTLVQLSAPLRRCDPGSVPVSHQSVPVCHPSARFRKRAASTPRHYLQRLCIKLYSPALTIIVTSCRPCPSSVRSSSALANLNTCDETRSFLLIPAHLLVGGQFHAQAKVATHVLCV